MQKISFEHGGPEYDRNYPDGIPTSVVVTDSEGRAFDSGMVMYPAGHARNTTADLDNILAHKFRLFGEIAGGSVALVSRFSKIGSRSAVEIASINDFAIDAKPGYED